MQTASRLVLAINVCLAAAHLTEQTNCAQDNLVKEMPPGTWRIDRPTVNQPVTEYTDITFGPNDIVEVEAGGCVQTGGDGKTWKRYVDPQGPNSDHLYHGLIWVPGATTSLVRLADVVGRRLKVTSACMSSSNGNYLRLGYEDDKYEDNNYLERNKDDGTGDQCKGLGNAYVVVKITRSDSVVQPEDLDLVWTQCDPNGMPLNPKWGWQVRHPGQVPDVFAMCGGFQYIDVLNPSKGVWFSPPKTPVPMSQLPTIDYPTIINMAVCWGGGALQSLKDKKPVRLVNLRGHANWGSCTYDGTIEWDSHKDFLKGGDDDYNMFLVRKDLAGLTTENGGKLQLEFDSDETIDYFKTPWWEAFHKAVDASDADARKMVDGKCAIVSGLFGVDVEHEAHAESHPVWALAIRTTPESERDEHWAMFVRNWGNEGFCSQNQHYVYLGRNVYTFRLPWRKGATACKVKGTPVFLTNNERTAGPYIRVINDLMEPDKNGVFVSFLLAEPAAQSRIHGELMVEWTGGVSGAAAPMTAVASAPAKEEGHGEALLAELYAALSVEQLKVFSENLGKRIIIKDSITPIEFIPAEKDIELMEILHRPHLLARPPVGESFDAVKSRKDLIRSDAFLKAWGGVVPDVERR